MVGSSSRSSRGPCRSAAISSIFIRSPSESSRTAWRVSCSTPRSSVSSASVLRNSAGGDRVDLAMELEAVGGGEVPPELVLLAHDQGELAAEPVGPLPGDEVEHPGLAAGGVDQPGEHLQRGGLARPVGAEEGHHLAGLDGEADAVDGADLAVLAAIEPADRPRHAFLLLEDAIGLGQLVASMIAMDRLGNGDWGSTLNIVGTGPRKHRAVFVGTAPGCRRARSTLRWTVRCRYPWPCTPLP